MYDPNGKRLSIDKLLQDNEGLIWERSLSNERGRLVDGNVYEIKGTHTIKFISRNEVCNRKPLKAKVHRVRIIVGGDRLECSDDTGFPAANLVETKILVNSTISDAKYGARSMSAYIVNYFLASPHAWCQIHESKNETLAKRYSTSIQHRRSSYRWRFRVRSDRKGYVWSEECRNLSIRQLEDTTLKTRLSACRRHCRVMASRHKKNKIPRLCRRL